MKKLLIMIAILTLMALSFGSLAQQNGYDLFQKALAKERAEGNLEEAIVLYQKVIDETKDESLAAKAQLRIGICYEKLGKEKAKLAQESFQKVIDDYPQQIETVKVAREKLSGLLRAQTLIQEGEREFKMRQLLPKLWDRFAKVSPDGRYLAYFNYDVGSMAVHELATGKERIIKSKIKEDEPEGESWSYTWSPDGEALICNWWQAPGWNWVDLRILRIDGTEQRCLFQSDEYDDVYPMDWSSDGNYILTAFYGGQLGGGIGLISVKNGSVRIIKTIDPKWGNMAFSPDDQYIVYDFLPEEEYSSRDISILSVNGKVEVPLITHPAHDSFLGWSPDGKHVLFASDRTGTNDLWIIAVKNGKPAGKPELIKKGLGNIDASGITPDGSFYYISPRQMEDIYVAEMDQSTGKIIDAPEKMILSREGSNRWPQYSPDGKSIVCVLAGGIRGIVENSLCVRSLDTGKELLFPLRTNALFPRWHPDGRFIYFTALDRSGHFGIQCLELKTGQVSNVLLEEPEEKHFGNLKAEVSPDGKYFYYVYSEGDDRMCRLYVRDLETGIKKELFRMAVRLPFVSSLSPDGKWLAIVSREEERDIQILPTTGGKTRELYRFKHSGGHPTWLDWTPDNKYIIFTKKNEDSGWGLYRISIEGGDLLNLGISTTFIDDISVHPSGKHLSFGSSGPEWKNPELWVMENFLPKPEDKK